MFVPTFVNLQGFIVNKKLIVKEVAVLKQEIVLTHYIFTSSAPWKFLTRSDRSSWLIAYHHGLLRALRHGPSKRICTSKIDRAKGIPSVVAKSAKSIAIEEKSEILGMFWRKGVKIANVLIINVIDAIENHKV
ncbi:hypothetical protein G5I_04824 [Acromyrmex echinatior]|uniref:Uncharacterized protein n=1 Tax=Acromyrmex echinatior TaxID=103372 RepID=F4WGN7_ACREC|nr:hypothetical protein G5I_04824 [Acromyrmex echinatior]